MNRLIVIGVSVFFLIIGVSVAFYYWGVNMNKVTSYQPYSFQYKQLSNGLQVILVKSDELPSISYDLMFKVGSKADPQSKQGLMYLLTETDQ